MKIVLTLIICYILGSIPFGYIVGELIKKIDIREYGSGNIGASNAFRILGPYWAILVLLGDFSKGFFSIYLSNFINNGDLIILIIAGLAVICGHDWSIFLKFKGGKGIASTFGVIFAINPIISISGGIIWGLTIILKRYSSLSSILSLISMTLLMILLHQPKEYIILSLILLFLAILRHKENIKRLKNGKEAKFGNTIKIK
jgi:glycerol-3-phosphate acyltransferase PlsY